jgi:L-2-hydroxyglutarate oxidase LhgO
MVKMQASTNWYRNDIGQRSPMVTRQLVYKWHRTALTSGYEKRIHKWFINDTGQRSPMVTRQASTNWFRNDTGQRSPIITRQASTNWLGVETTHVSAHQWSQGRVNKLV